jgi:hypothetical protein
MNTEPKEAADQPNSENEKDGGKSEEFLNFERGMKRVLGLSKKQVEEVIRQSPNDQDEEKAENS